MIAVKPGCKQTKKGNNRHSTLRTKIDKEGQIDKLHTMYTKGKISEKDYRMWFMLNNRTRISILTPVGETDNATIMNGIGQISFVAALASPNNKGTAVYDITKGEVSANIGNMPQTF